MVEASYQNTSIIGKFNMGRECSFPSPTICGGYTMNYERQLKRKDKIIEVLTEKNRDLQKQVSDLKIENKHLSDDNNKYRQLQESLEQTISEYTNAISAARKIENDYRNALKDALTIKKGYSKQMEELLSRIGK